MQLRECEVHELTFRTRVPNKAIKVEEFGLGFARSPYDSENRWLDVLISFEAGSSDLSSAKYYFKVEIRGRFENTEGSSEAEKIERWAENAAQFVMIPYLREHVYSISLRCGMKPIVIPLYQLPAPVPAAMAPGEPLEHKDAPTPSEPTH